MKNAASAKMGPVFVVLVVLLLVGLPVAVWMDLSSLAESNLRRQASDVNSIITSVRDFYATNVVGRILSPRPEPRPKCGAQLRRFSRRHSASSDTFA